MEANNIGLYAVDISQLSPDKSSWENVRLGIDLDSLPRVLVSAPATHVKDAAILSWRWDREHFLGKSRNVALALLHARESGLSYLFLDYVSVEQSLSKTALLQKVLQFGQLYAKIPVIAAYDEDGKNSVQFHNDLRRPWILHELRKSSTNPTSITHVGFRSASLPRRQSSFENEIYLIRKSGFAHVIYDLLEETVRMTSIEDLALILPEFEIVFSSAFTAMSRTDYLLSAFLLTAYYQPGQQVDKEGTQVGYGLRINYHETCFEKDGFFDRYTLGPSGSTGRSFEWEHNILLDGKPVAILRTKMTSSYNRNWIEVLPSAESHILDSLKLVGEARTNYEMRQAEKRASLYVDQTAPEPAVNERLAAIEKEDWSAIPNPEGASLGFISKKK